MTRINLGKARSQLADGREALLLVVTDPNALDDPAVRTWTKCRYICGNMADDPKKPNEDDKELRRVIAQERARGKRHVDPEAEEKQRRLERTYLEICRECEDEDSLKKVLPALGVDPGSPKYQQVL